jgi:hypothetical protein
MTGTTRRGCRARLAAVVLAASFAVGCNAGSASKPSAAGPDTGAQLSGLFPTKAELPPGWVLNEGNGQEADSGAALYAPPYLATLPRQSCAGWQGVDAQFLLSGDQASHAQITVMVGHGTSTSLGSINLAGYYPGWAARQFSLIDSLAYHRCGPFAKRDEITGARVLMKPAVATVSGVGDQAVAMTILQVNGPLPDGSYYPGDYLLVVRVGSYIADVDAPAFPGTSPAREVAAVMSRLVQRFRQLG